MKLEIEELTHEFEAQTDEAGVPIIRRFVIHKPLSTETLAVVEAYTANEARDRFERLRHYFRTSLKAVVDDFFAVNLAPEGFSTETLPLFSNLFFEVLEYPNRIVH